MKIDIESLKSSNSDILPKCMELIKHIKSAPDEESFFARLIEVYEWQPQFGKSEMSRWADILNMCDEVLEKAVTCVDPNGVLMAVDNDPEMVRRVSAVLSFTSLLFENTFTRSIYSSIDRLLLLLDSDNMDVIVDSLRLLQMISKRSRFLSQHLSQVQQKQLTNKLIAIVQCWNGKLRNMKMDECCTLDVSIPSLLPISYRVENSTKLIRHIQSDTNLSVEMHELLLGEAVDDEERISMHARLRLVRAFNTIDGRRLGVIARLLAISVLVYSRTLLEEWQLNSMLYDSLVEEISRLLLVDIVPYDHLVDGIKTEALKTLTSIISLDRPAKQNIVIECLGVDSYHGYMARTVRKCVDDLRCGCLDKPGHTSIQFCTALFSLLYHLAEFDSGGEALVYCALTESLLSVVECETVPLEQISFATRAVRVLDIMTSLDANAFTNNNGMNVMINRLAVEVKKCKKVLESNVEPTKESCHQQRAALIKSLLNFIKRAIQDSQFADSVRHIMDGALPSALIEIISRCDFFGASLFHNAVGLVTNFIYQEPSLLTTVQDKGVTSAIMDAVFHKELPASRDILTALPNTFTALCLNDRGLQAFINENPFDHLCNVLISTKFITAMKRRRNEMNEAAVSLGSALDDLLRHQPTLRPLLLKSIVKMLTRLTELSSVEQNQVHGMRCVMSLSSSSTSSQSSNSGIANSSILSPVQSNVNVATESTSMARDGEGDAQQNTTGGQDGNGTDGNNNTSNANDETSDEDDDDDPPSAAPNMEEVTTISNMNPQSATADLGLATEMNVNGEKLLPLGEYLLNIGKLLETLLTQSASSEHAEDFIKSGALEKLISLLCVKQIILDLSQSIFPQLVSNIVRYLYQQTRSERIIEMVTERMMTYCEDLIEKCKLTNDALRRDDVMCGIVHPTTNDGTAVSSATPVDPNECVSLMYQFPINYVLPQLCSISILSSLVSNLSKMSFGVNPSLRTAIFKFWTNKTTGLKLINTCHHVQMMLSWESAVLQAFNSVIKVSSSTQTDDVDEVEMSASGGATTNLITFDVPSEKTSTADEDSVAHLVGSVGTECVPAPQKPTTSCPPYLLSLMMMEDCWLRTKSGVTAIGRCQRQLNELMVMLTKVCTSVPPRRRTPEPTGVSPDKNSVLLAEHLLSGYKVALESPPRLNAVSSIVLPYLSGWITNLCAILIDDRRMPYHLMLSAFYRSGCHASFMSLLDKHISLPIHAEFAQEVERFLKNWLSLAENLVNAHAFNHSPHKLARLCDEAKRFPANNYLSLLQQDVLKQMRLLFDVLMASYRNGTANVTLCELTISLYKQLIKGIINSSETTKSSVSAEERNRLIGELDEASVNFLVDMGFDRDTVIEALFEYATVEEATEFLVANDRQQQNLLSNQPEEDADNVDFVSEERREGDERDESSAMIATPPQTQQPQLQQPEQQQEQPLDLATMNITPIDMNTVIENTCTEIIPICMEVVELGVELVFNTSDLLSAIIDSVDAKWRENVLVKKYFVSDIVKMLRNLTTHPDDEKLTQSLSTRLHLSCLLWDSIADEYLSESTKCSLESMLISILEFIASKQSHALMKLIAPVCLWFDLYSKMLTMKSNKTKMQNSVDSLVWKYWSADGTGSGQFTWINYRPAAVHTLNTAFYRGNSGAELTIEGKQYAINFATMTHRSLESNVERPITVIAKLKENINVEDIFKVDDSIMLWNEVVRSRLVPILISLMQMTELDSNAVHALLILSARFTRNFDVAVKMLQDGGIKALLNLPGSSIPTRALLIALIIRHCIDDETALSQIFEKTIRTVAAGGYNLRTSSSRWHHRMPRSTRDWMHAMRALAPLCARHPQLFYTTVKRVARKQNSQITAVPAAPSSETVTPKLSHSASARKVIQLLIAHMMDFSWDDSNRIVQRSLLINLLAELVKSYSAVASLLVEAPQHHTSQTLLLTLLDKCITTTTSTNGNTGTSSSSATTNHLLSAINGLVMALASCNHSPKAQESLVVDIGSALRLAYAETDPKVATTKIKALCDMILLARDVCQSGGHDSRSAAPSSSTSSTTNQILRLIIKKRICIELTKVAWHLNLSTKEGIDALNHVLKTLDELTRSINNASNTSNQQASEGGAGTAAGATAPRRISLTTTTTTTESAHPSQTSAVTSSTSAAAQSRTQPASSTSAGAVSSTGDVSETRNGTETGGSSNVSAEETVNTTVTATRMDAAASHHSSPSTPTQHQPSRHQRYILEGFDDDLEENLDGQPLTEEDSSETDEEDEEEEEDNPDEEMEFEDDDGDVNEIDIVPDTDEDEEREDETMQEEEGQESDEEDGFGLIQTTHEGDDEGQFEDREPLSHFLDANVFLDNLDDIDRSTGFEISRPDRSALNEVSVHPLMQRTNILASEPVAMRNSGYRFMIPGRRAAAVSASGLHRQGAVRRWGTVAPQRDILERLIDGGTVSNATPNFLDGLLARQQFHVILYDNANDNVNGGASMGVDDRRNTPVPLPLERFTEAALLIDAHSHFYVWLILAQQITAHLDEIEAREKEEKKASEEAKNAESNNRQTTSDETNEVPNSNASEERESSDRPAADEIRVLDPDEDVSISRVPLREMDTIRAEDDSGGVEPMDTSEGLPNENTESSSLPAQQEQHQQQEGEAVDAEHERRTQQETSSNTSGMVVDTTSDVPLAENISDQQEQQSVQMIDDTTPPSSNIAQQAAQPSSEEQQQQQQQQQHGDESRADLSTPIDDYRDILGDIEIPEGVDPAFLAALPEDIRAEVIRDHERQQRAQRLVAQQASAAARNESGDGSGAERRELDAEAAAGAAHTESGGGATSMRGAEEGIEQLDQDFLNALPPELQEEILAQHERSVRLANERAAAQSAVAESSSGAAGTERAPATSEGDDAAALIESLPPSLRAQVLADADDTVLQVLPQSVAAEARRLRANLEQQQVMRFARMFAPGRFHRISSTRQTTLGGGSAQLGALAGTTTLASKSATQLLDRDSIVTLIMLFLIDPARITSQRLQKVIRSICAEHATCDFVVWCLVALLDKITANSSRYEDFAGCTTGWIDHICVSSSFAQNERAVKFLKNSNNVVIHPAVATNATRVIIEMLTSLARVYPGHFVPLKLRANYDASSASTSSHQYPLTQFWHYVYSISKGDSQSHSRGGHRLHSSSTGSGEFGLSSSSLSPNAAAILSSTLPNSTLEDSAIGILMSYLKRSVVRTSTQLQDRFLRLLCTIVQTLPDDTLTKLGITEGAQRSPLQDQLDTVVTVLTEGKCSEEGLTEGRNFLMEAIRALSGPTKALLDRIFIAAAERLGHKLMESMRELHKQLETIPIRSEDSSANLMAMAAGAPSSSTASPLTPSTAIPTASNQPSTSSRRTTVNRYDESTVVVDGLSNWREVMNKCECDELQLPIIRAIIDKHGLQNTLLRTLQIIIKMKQAFDTANKNKQSQQQQQQQQQPQSENAAGEGEASSERGDTVEQSKDSEQQSSKVDSETLPPDNDRLSVLLSSLDPLWELVSACLQRLAKSDAHAALALQPAAEAFFLVHGHTLSGIDPSKYTQHPDAVKLVQFAEKHRSVLNQVLRQSGTDLSDGPFAILIQMPKLLDFDVKRKYFRKQMQKLDGPVRNEDVAVRIRRSHLFSDSFRELFRMRGPEWKARFYIIFEGEEGQDAGGLLREWFSIITREIFNPNYALFITAPGDRVTYMINKTSYINPEHLDYFKFVGRLIAKAVYENKLLDCFFTRAFYKHILNLPVRAQDLESEDPSFYKSLEFLLNNPIEELGTELTFSLEVEEFGVRKMKELKEGGANVTVTDENKEEYVKLVCQMKMTGSIKQQLSAFLDGFYEIIPKRLISMFNEQELELLISGLPNIDIDDLYANTEYKAYNKTSPQIKWFWKALRSFEQEDRAKFLQFVTGTSKVPLQGFASLEGMNGIQKFSIHMDSRSDDRLPAAHTCFNQLDLPAYDSYEKLRDMLLLAVRECSEGFGFA